MTEKLVDRHYIAEHFGVSLPTVDRWIRDGIPCFKPSRGVVRFDLAEVAAWAKSRTPEKAAV